MQLTIGSIVFLATFFVVGILTAKIIYRKGGSGGPAAA
jgi:hypothetical protein